MFPKLTRSVIVCFPHYELMGESVKLLGSFDPAEQRVGVSQIKAVNGYVPVAAVAIPDGMEEHQALEHAYAMLQNGGASDSWTVEPPKGVIPLVAPIEHAGKRFGHRSAMMGDLLELGGNQFIVAAHGFTIIA